MATEKIVKVLDSSAIIAYLRNEEGAIVVHETITDPKIVCYAHAINLCEVYYDAIRVGGLADADTSLNGLFTLGLVERNDFDISFWKEVAWLKADKKASLADFCGIVLTNRLMGSFLTCDHHELDKIAAEVICPIQFIR